MLSADQKNYVVAAYFQSANIIKTLIQLIVAYYYRNYYAWVAIELLFGVLGSIVLNRKIDKVYPWLKSSIKLGKQQSKKYPNILKSSKQVFIHKIKDFLLQQSDQLFIFVFVSLKMVAYYGNYVLIISRLTNLFSTVLDSVGASIGNLVAENDKSKMMHVFWEIMALRYLIAGFVCYNLYHLISPFIILWLGKEYILPHIVLILLLINLFIGISRGTVDNFNFAYGHYADIWAAWVEGFLNLSVTIIGGYLWGIPGILLGKTVSLIPIIVFWKPYYLFRDGFNDSYKEYWNGTYRYYLIFSVSAIISHFILKGVSFDPSGSFLLWTIYSLICASVFGIIYLIAFIRWAPGGRNLLQRLPLKKIGIKI